jgi:hypothetical protein
MLMKLPEKLQIKEMSVHLHQILKAQNQKEKLVNQKT